MPAGLMVRLFTVAADVTARLAKVEARQEKMAAALRRLLADASVRANEPDTGDE